MTISNHSIGQLDSDTGFTDLGLGNAVIATHSIASGAVAFLLDGSWCAFAVCPGGAVVAIQLVASGIGRTNFCNFPTLCGKGNIG